MKMNENSLSSPEIHQFLNYNTSILKGQKLHLLTIMEYVRKQDSFKKEIGEFSYELRVHSLFREQLWRSQAGTKRLWQIRMEACQCRLGQ